MLEIWLNFDWPVLLSGYLGLLLLGASFISAGILISAQTDNQIVAAASAFGLLLLFWLVSWAAELAGPKMQGLFNFLSLFEHYENFPKGILDTKDVVYYASFIWIFQFLTLRTLASKRYRG